MASNREREREDQGTRRGESGGQSSLHSEKVSAAQFAQYMKGITFPARKKDIVNQAKSNGAPQNVMQYFNDLPDREYERANEIESEFGKLKE